MFQRWINAESFPVSQLCVNILLATKITLNTNAMDFGSLRVKTVFVTGKDQRLNILIHNVDELIPVFYLEIKFLT
jgi:hypothetical protein